MSERAGRDAFRDLLVPTVAGDTLDRLAVYAELIERWGHTHNLVRFASREELVRRHLLEAVAAAPLLGERGLLVDVGSGAGLPGVPLLVARPGWRGLLLEPRQKRWAFLRHVIRELGLDASVLQARFQEVGDGAFDLVTARALGGYPELLAWAKGRLAPGGMVLLWATSAVRAELGETHGWRVLSSPLPASQSGCLVRLDPCST